MLRNFYRKLLEKLTRKYRIEIIDDVMLSQSRQFAIKPITVIFLSLLLFASIVISTASLIIFTPSIRQNIPGYLNPAYTAEQNKLLDQLTLIERRIHEQDTIIKSLRQLAGIEGDSLKEEMVKNLDSAEQIRESEAKENKLLEAETAKLAAEKAEAEAETNIEVSDPPTVEVVEQPLIQEQKPQKNRTPAVRASYHSPLLNLFLPLSGTKLKGFSKENQHYGVDIVADEKAFIRSAADGFVVVSEFSDESGLMLAIQSRNDIVSIYKHNSRLLKKVGDYVYAGEPIAVIGNSGENTNGPHLHFELWYKGQPIDPSNYIQFH